MKWTIVGKGALGSWLSSRLLDAGQEVTALLRDPKAKDNVFRYQGQDYKINAQKDLSSSDVIVAAVKAYDVAPLLEQLAPVLSQEQPPVLVLSFNGMLLNEAEWMPRNSYFWVTTHGFYRTEEMLCQGGFGQSWLGPSTDTRQQDPWRQVFMDAVSPCDSCADISYQRWQKLAVNCLINPLTVIHQCENGKLLGHIAAHEWPALADEIVTVAATQNIELDASEIIAKATEVAHKTSTNRSSMLSDVQLGRRTEIDAMNGFIVQLAQQEGLSAPANHKLWLAVTENH